MIFHFINTWPTAATVIVTILVLFFSIFTMKMANVSNRSIRFWLLLSLVFPLITFVILVLLPRKEKQAVALSNEEVFDHLFRKK